MKRFLFVMVALALVIGGASAQTKKPQWDAKAGQFKIEKDAKITLGLDTDKYGTAIVALWDKVHPEAAGQVEFLNTPSDASAKRMTDLQGEAPDVVMTLTNDVPKNLGSMATIDPNLVKIANDNVDPAFMKQAGSLGKKGLIAIPFGYDGMAFAWNKTELTKLGLISGKVTKDNLPVEFDTWEKIFALAKSWNKARPSYNGKTVNIAFPFSLDNTWGAFSVVTAGGWEIFKAGATKPGFDSPDFLKGLEFLKAAADAKVSVEADGSLTPGASRKWDWDAFMNDQTAPFGQIGTWMPVGDAMIKGDYDMQFAPMPTWGGKRLKPLLQVKVFAMNAYSKFPSASAELLRLLYTKEGMQAMIEGSSYVPALKTGAKIAPDYSKDKIKQQMGYAFQFSYVTPVTLFLPNNPAKQAFDVYYSIGMDQFYKDVWDGKTTPKDAQKAIVSAAAAWVTENNKK